MDVRQSSTRTPPFYGAEGTENLAALVHLRRPFLLMVKPHHKAIVKGAAVTLAAIITMLVVLPKKC